MKKNLYLKLAIIIGFCVSFVVPSWAAFVNLDKVKIKITASPGSSEAGVITVENREDRKIFVKIYAMEWQYVKPFNGSKKFFPLGTIYKDIERWFRFSPKEMTLAPGERSLVHYKVEIPKDIKESCYLVLFFETDVGGSDVVKGEKKVGIQFLTRIGTLFLIEPEGVVLRKAELLGASIGEKGITLKIRNKGNCALIGKVSVFAMDENDMLVGRSKSTKIYAPSKSEFEFVVPFDGSDYLRAKKLLVTVQEETGKVYSWEYSI